MNEYHKGQLLDRFSLLDERLQWAVLSDELEEACRDIAIQHRLSPAQWREIADEVRYVLLGIAEQENFKRNLVGSVRVSDEAASEIELVVKYTVFIPVKRSLETLEKALKEEKKEERSTTDELLAPMGVTVKPPIPHHRTPQSPPHAPPPEGLVIMPRSGVSSSPAKPPMPPQAPPPPERVEPPTVPKPEWKPEEHLITPHPSLPGERPGDAVRTFTTPPQKPPVSIFEQKISDFYKAPKENGGGSGDAKDPYREEMS